MTGLVLAADPNDIQAAKTLGALACPLLCVLPVFVMVGVILVSFWKVFTKAGQPGWYSLVPFYNGYILCCEIAKKDVIWFFLEFVPIVNIYAGFMVSMELAKKFGKSEGFGIGLALLPMIFFPILAFGDARYRDGRSRRFVREADDEDDYDDPRDRRRNEGEFDEDDDDRRRPNRRRRDDDDYEDDYEDNRRRGR